MKKYSFTEKDSVRDLVQVAYQHDEPVLVLDGDEECLVAMRPSALERVLFERDQLNCVARETLHL